MILIFSEIPHGNPRGQALYWKSYGVHPVSVRDTRYNDYYS